MTPDIHAEFEFSEDGCRVTKCANGHTPKKNSYNKSNGQVVASFDRTLCDSCPHKDICRPKMNQKTSRKTISVRSKNRAVKQRFYSTQKFKDMAKFRNGVETIPSVLRRKYGIDHMPVRGELRTKFYLGCKIGAVNVRKFCKYLQSMGSCAQKPVMA